MNWTYVWTATIVILGIPIVLKLVDVLWVIFWTPFKIRRHMRKLGYVIPPSNFLGATVRVGRSTTSDGQKETLQHIPHHDIEHFVLPFVAELRQRYGNTFLHSCGATGMTLVTSDPAATKPFLTSNWKLSQPTKIGADWLFGRYGILTSEGSDWVRQRRVVTLAFTGERLKKLIGGAILDSTKRWLDELGMHVANAGGFKELDIHAETGSLIKEIQSKSLFGNDYYKGQDAFHADDNLNVCVGEYMVWPLSLSRCFSIFGRVDRTIASMEKTVLQIIQSRRKGKAYFNKDKDYMTENSKSCDDDFLGRIMAAASDDSKILKSRGEKWTDKHLVDQIRTMLTAGYDTIHAHVSWCMLLLAHHTDWQDKIRAEVQEIFGPDLPHHLDLEKLSKLHLLGMFMSETLRLYPPTMLLDREIPKDGTMLLDKPMPKHLAIFINNIALHRDPELWGSDALEFKPERFREGIATACKDPVQFITFGGGTRPCAGQKLALMEAKSILSMFLQQFRFHLSPSYRHRPTSLLTIIPKYGVPIILQPTS